VIGSIGPLPMEAPSPGSSFTDLLDSLGAKPALNVPPGEKAPVAPEGTTVLALRYEDVCAAPREAVERIRGLLGAKGFAPALRDFEPPAFEARAGELADEFGARVEEAIEHYSAAFAGEAP